MLLPNNLLQTNVEGYLPTNYDTTFYNTNESITFKKLSYEKKIEYMKKTYIIWFATFNTYL